MPPTGGRFKCHARKTRATVERIRADVGHARRDHNARKTRAIRERIRADGGTSRNDYSL